MGVVLALAAIWAIGLSLIVITSPKRAIGLGRADLAKLAAKAALPAEGLDDGPVLERFVARRRGRMVGTAIGLIPVAVATSLMPLVEQPGQGGAWWVATIPLGASIGAAIGTLRVTPLAPSGRRTASLNPRRLEQYLPPRERLLARACLVPLGLSLLVTLVYLAVGRPSAFAWLSLASVAAALAVWGIAGSVAQRVLDQPAPAAGPVELFWHEVVRTLALRDVVTVRGALVLAGAVPAILLIAQRGVFNDDAGLAGSVLIGAAVVVGVLIFVLAVLQMVVQADDARLDWFRAHAGKGVMA